MADIKILLYHSVGDVHADDKLGIRIEKERFRDQLELLKKTGYKVWTLREAVAAIGRKRPISGNAVVITFDDGYKDNIADAAPVIEDFGFRAAFFATVDYVGKIKTSPKRAWQRWECMDGHDLAELAARGHDVGSHGLHHVDLTTLDVKTRREEVGRSREMIRTLIKSDVEFFSYPYGSFDEGLAAMVREAGYKAACTIIAGGNDSTTDLYRLKRIEIVHSDTIDDFKKKLG